MSIKNERAVRKSPAENQAEQAAKPAAPPIDWRRQGLIAGLLGALVLLAYFNCFRSGFVMDNKPIILDDPRVHAATSQNIDEIWSKGYWYRQEDPSLYRPLTTLSYLFNYAVLGNGANPAGYHAVNLILHAINAILVYCLGLVLFRKTAPAVAVAALWAVHPVLVESVTNIVGRADELSCLGVLGALLCHTQAPEAKGARRLAWMAGLTAAAAIGVLSKESSVVLLLLMLVYDLAFRKERIRAGLAGYGCVSVVLALFLYQRAQVLATLSVFPARMVVNPLIDAGFWVAKLTAIQIIGRYLLLLAWPAVLSCDYSYNQIPLFRGTFNNWGDWASVLALAVCIAAALLAAWWFRRNKPGFFFVALFFIALAPVANIAMPIGTIMAERLLYLPAVGFIGCAVCALYAAVDRFAGDARAAASRLSWVVGLLCLVLIVRVHFRNNDWENSRTLFTSAVASAPASYRSHFFLASSLFQDPALLDQAIAESQKALAILQPVSSVQVDIYPYVAVSAYHMLKGDRVEKSGAPDAVEQSQVWYRKTLDILLRGVEVDRAQIEEVARLAQAAGRPKREADTSALYQELGKVYLKLGQPQKAREALDHGLWIHPGYAFLQLISDASSAQHDRNGAAIALMEGAIMYPEQKGFTAELLRLYQDGDSASGCAVQKTAGGTGLNFGCPVVRGHLCAAMVLARGLYTRMGQTAEAEKLRIGSTQSLGCPAQ